MKYSLILTLHPLHLPRNPEFPKEHSGVSMAMCNPGPTHTHPFSLPLTGEQGFFTGVMELLPPVQSTALGMQGGEPGNAVYLQVSRSTLSCPAQLHRASPGKVCPPQGRRNVQFCSELSARAVVGKQLQQFPGFQSLVSGCSHEALSVLGCVREQGYGFKQNIIYY